MFTEFSIILHALRKHRTILLLILSQIALACIVLSAGTSAIRHRFSLQNLSNEMSEGRLFVLSVDELRRPLTQDQRQLVLKEVEASASVESVAIINSLPFQGQESSYGLSKTPDGDKLSVAFFYGTPTFIETIGARVTVGRSFTRDEFTSGDDPFVQAPSIILTRSLAKRLSVSVGQTVYVDGRQIPIVGIIEDLLRPGLSSISEAHYAALVPASPQTPGQMFLISRFREGFPASATRAAVEAATRATSSDFVWSGSLLAEQRDRYFRMDRLVASIMFSVGVVLLLVVAGGIGGLSNYWIVLRRKQTRIRRALGATKRDIELFFRVENFVVCAVGVLIAMTIFASLREHLISWLGLPNLSLTSAVIPALALLLVAQLAISIPIRRALKD